MTTTSRVSGSLLRGHAGDRTRERRALRNAVNAIFAQSASVERAVPRLLRLIGTRQKWQRGAFWLVDPERGVLECVALWKQRGWAERGFAAESRARAFEPGDGLPGRAYARRHPIWVPDLARDREFLRGPAAAREGLRAALAVPIVHGPRVLGVLEFLSARAVAPDGEALDDVLAIASLFGQFAERIRAQDAVRASEARKSAIVQAALDAIITVDQRGVVLEFNPAAERTFGHPAAAAIGKELVGLIIPPGERPRYRAALAPGAGAGDGGVLGRRVETTALRADGTEFPIELTITPISRPGPRLFTWFVRDITAQRDAARRTADLQAVTAALSEALTPGQVADVILSRARAAVGAEGGAVYVAGADGTSLELLGHAGPVDALTRQAQLPLTWAVPVVEVYRTRTPLFAPSRSAMLAALPEMARWFPSEAARACAPLLVRGRSLGVLWYLFAGPREFDEADRRFVLALADQCAQALERAQLYAREHRVAETLQRAFLPATLPDMPGIRIRASYRAASRESAVGGDWYDAFHLPDGRIALSVGDVVGHGLQAAVVMGQVRQAVRAAALQAASPAAVLQQVNEVLRLTYAQQAMATAVLGYLDPALGTFTYAVAGHPLPLVGLPDGSVQMLHAAGLPLGVGKTLMTGEQSVSLPLDALLVLYSDGLIEIDRNVESGEAALREAVAAEVRRRPANPAEDILRRVFRGRSPADDVVALTATIVEPPRTQFGLSLAATPDTSRVVRYTLQRFLQAAGVDRERSEGFLVAVGEAVNNAVEHAYPMLDGIVDVRGRRDADRVTVAVADRGRWRREAAPGRPAHRGHGLALMRVLSDGVEVECSGTGTRVVLTLRTR